MTTAIAFFNNKGGVGKTSLVYHLAWMYAELGLRVVAADLDPQANLTAAFIDDDRLEEVWKGAGEARSIFSCVEPLLRRTGDIADPRLEILDPRLGLLVGDLALSGFEDQLSQEWPKCLDRQPEGSLRVISAFWRILQRSAAVHRADAILMDMGPNLGAINRSALIAADAVVVPLGPDLFSLQGLQNLGPTFRDWRDEWAQRRQRNTSPDLRLPEGRMAPAGYVVMQHAVRLDRPARAYDRWIARIPSVYRKVVLGEPADESVRVHGDPHCLALLRHYRSLMPLAQEARKPMFFLKPADGAIGAHAQAARTAYADFKRLAEAIAEAIDLPLPSGANLA